MSMFIYLYILCAVLCFHSFYVAKILESSRRESSTPSRHSHLGNEGDLQSFGKSVRDLPLNLTKVRILPLVSTSRSYSVCSWIHRCCRKSDKGHRMEEHVHKPCFCWLPLLFPRLRSGKCTAAASRIGNVEWQLLCKSWLLTAKGGKGKVVGLEPEYGCMCLAGHCIGSHSVTEENKKATSILLRNKANKLIWTVTKTKSK